MPKEAPLEIVKPQGVSRRCFVQGAVAGAAILAINAKSIVAYGEPLAFNPAELKGKRFELTIDSLDVNFTGRHATATAVNGSVPGPILRWKEGDTVTLTVTNRLKEPASIHWHGMRIPNSMDGVPGLSFAGIAPGETYQYEFPVLQNGTYWYHSHSRFQEQTGLLGAIIIEPNEKDPVQFDREYVMLLTDWTDTDPETIFSNLKQQSDYYNFRQRTAGTFFSDVREKGLVATVSNRLTWGRMNMSPTDISDVSGSTYTYLLNGNTPNRNWTGLFRPGERIRLRVINGSSMTFFDVRIPGLKMTVVQADGNDVEPVSVDEFRIGVAETYDIIVEPKEEVAYTFFAQAEDRTGYARGTLTPKEGMSAAVPPMDPRPMRTMVDMGMGSMGGMKMDGGNMAGMDGMKQEDMPASGSKMSTAMPMPEMKKDEMEDMKSDSGPVMDMPSMKMGSEDGKTPFPQPGPGGMPVASMAGMNMKQAAPSKDPVKKLQLGPQVNQVSMMVSERLDKPGDGLNHNGRRVLTYADLRARYRGTDGRPPTREIELHLSGNMERYIWGFDGQKFSSAEPIVLKLGERVRFTLINDTMMEHPIHLHGLWSELENGNGEFNPYKHTVTVKPSERVSYLVSADTPGRWAYHCHLLYHMEAGMFRTVEVLA